MGESVKVYPIVDPKVGSVMELGQKRLPWMDFQLIYFLFKFLLIFLVKLHHLTQQMPKNYGV
jgi:hypothetical protein